MREQRITDLAFFPFTQSDAWLLCGLFIWKPDLDTSLAAFIMRLSTLGSYSIFENILDFSRPRFLEIFAFKKKVNTSKGVCIQTCKN